MGGVRDARPPEAVPCLAECDKEGGLPHEDRASPCLPLTPVVCCPPPLLSVCALGMPALQPGPVGAMQLLPYPSPLHRGEISAVVMEDSLEEVIVLQGLERLLEVGGSEQEACPGGTASRRPGRMR